MTDWPEHLIAPQTKWFRLLEKIFRTDPVLGNGRWIKTWDTLDGRRRTPDPNGWTSGELPLAAMTPGTIPASLAEAAADRIQVTVELKVVVPGLIVDNLLNTGHLFRLAIFPEEDPERPDKLARREEIDIWMNKVHLERIQITREVTYEGVDAEDVPSLVGRGIITLTGLTRA